MQLSKRAKQVFLPVLQWIAPNAHKANVTIITAPTFLVFLAFLPELSAFCLGSVLFGAGVMFRNSKPQDILHFAVHKVPGETIDEDGTDNESNGHCGMIMPKAQKSV